MTVAVYALLPVEGLGKQQRLVTLEDCTEDVLAMARMLRFARDFHRATQAPTWITSFVPMPSAGGPLKGGVE